VHPSRHKFTAALAHGGNSHLAQSLAQFVETLLEECQHVAAACLLPERHCRAPGPLALRRFRVREEVSEAGHQVGLGEHDVHWRKDLQLLDEVLHALAQVAGQLQNRLGIVATQLSDADRDDDAIDRRPRPLFLQQAEEAMPFLPVHGLHRITAGCIEQNSFRRKEPVALTCTADTLDRLRIGKRKLQTRLLDRAAFTSSRIANHHIPRQFVQGLRTACPAKARVPDRADRLQHCTANRIQVGFGSRLGRCQQLGLTPLCEMAAGSPHRQRQHGGGRNTSQRPHQRELQEFGAEEEQPRQQRKGQCVQGTPVCEQVPGSLQHDGLKKGGRLADVATKPRCSL